MGGPPKALVTALNKLLKGKDTDHAKIHAMYMRLILVDKETWLPLYQMYMTRTNASLKAFEKEPELRDPFDRGGK